MQRSSATFEMQCPEKGFSDPWSHIRSFWSARGRSCQASSSAISRIYITSVKTHCMPKSALRPRRYSVYKQSNKMPAWGKLHRACTIALENPSPRHQPRKKGKVSRRLFRDCKSPHAARRVRISIAQYWKHREKRKFHSSL